MSPEKPAAMTSNLVGIRVVLLLSRAEEIADQSERDGEREARDAREKRSDDDGQSRQLTGSPAHLVGVGFAVERCGLAVDPHHSMTPRRGRLHARHSGKCHEREGHDPQRAHSGTGC